MNRRVLPAKNPSFVVVVRLFFRLVVSRYILCSGRFAGSVRHLPAATVLHQLTPKPASQLSDREIGLRSLCVDFHYRQRILVPKTNNLVDLHGGRWEESPAIFSNQVSSELISSRSFHSRKPEPRWCL